MRQRFDAGLWMRALNVINITIGSMPIKKKSKTDWCGRNVFSPSPSPHFSC